MRCRKADACENEILHVRNFIYTRTEIPPRTDERKKPCPTPTKAVFGLSTNSRSATNVKSLHDGHAGHGQKERC